MQAAREILASIKLTDGLSRTRSHSAQWHVTGPNSGACQPGPLWRPAQAPPLSPVAGRATARNDRGPSESAVRAHHLSPGLRALPFPVPFARLLTHTQVHCTMSTYKIVTLPGDGIGKFVLRVLVRFAFPHERLDSWDGTGRTAVVWGGRACLSQVKGCGGC